MEYKDIRYTVDGDRIATLTFDRPDRMNAYTLRMCDEIVHALTTYTHDDDARVLIITGTGRGFCTGADQKVDDFIEAAKSQLGHGLAMRRSLHAVNLALYRLDKPVIGMINGAAVAGGLSIALLCDLRIAGDDARLGDTSGKIGLLPDEGGAWLAPRFMGIEAAMRMTLLNEVYDAHQAQRLGLVGEVVPQDQLERRTREVARELASKAPLAQRVAKRLMRMGLEISFQQSLADAELATFAVNDSDDVKEGKRAFREKRQPIFEGR
ncbi:MAG: enoyl-CoA hydratase-related protein [Actinomycetota bacterium]